MARNWSPNAVPPRRIVASFARSRVGKSSELPSELPPFLFAKEASAWGSKREARRGAHLSRWCHHHPGLLEEFWHGQATEMQTADRSTSTSDSTPRSSLFPWRRRAPSADPSSPPLAAMSRATGASKAKAGAWREGRVTPRACKVWRRGLPPLLLNELSEPGRCVGEGDGRRGGRVGRRKESRVARVESRE